MEGSFGSLPGRAAQGEPRGLLPEGQVGGPAWSEVESTADNWPRELISERQVKLGGVFRGRYNRGLLARPGSQGLSRPREGRWQVDPEPRVRTVQSGAVAGALRAGEAVGRRPGGPSLPACRRADRARHVLSSPDAQRRHPRAAEKGQEVGPHVASKIQQSPPQPRLSPAGPGSGFQPTELSDNNFLPSLSC